ncbi:MAG: YHS domain-containing protein [Planctomycetales bacterium]|nr:YHS domain-containing protein [Planctomycetales bacterium]MCA9146422.1 YHS domain-containing protein [Planctomycetales bacterium]
MSNLVDFSKRLEEQLAGTNREPHWEAGEAERYMSDVDVRRGRFEEIAVRLNDTLVQPRLETLASYFSNASLTENESVGRCACWFGYCERFPVSTRVTFAVEHDTRFEKVAVCYDATMMPVFIKFNEHDRLTLNLDEVEDDRVTDWVEERLSEFLDAYLRIDRGGEEFLDEAATDPVCGMRISRSSAAASDAYRGHPYYFCSTRCQEQFSRAPTTYVQVKTM